MFVLLQMKLFTKSFKCFQRQSRHGQDSGDETELSKWNDQHVVEDPKYSYIQLLLRCRCMV